MLELSRELEVVQQIVKFLADFSDDPKFAGEIMKSDVLKRLIGLYIDLAENEVVEFRIIRPKSCYSTHWGFLPI
jgi:ethanolamine utilization cobalamin adenosyltransferase